MRSSTSDRDEDEFLGFDVSEEAPEHAAATDAVAICTLNGGDHVIGVPGQLNAHGMNAQFPGCSSAEFKTE